MVRAGVDADNEIIYVGRAFHAGNMIPAKVVPAKGTAFISYGKHSFSYLTNFI